jgi:hypothetical protein
LLIFSLWFFIHKYRQDKVKNNPSTTPDLDAATAAAFHNRQSEISELVATEPKIGLTANNINKAPVNVYRTVIQDPSRRSVPPAYTAPPPPAGIYSRDHYTGTDNATAGSGQLAFPGALPPCSELDGKLGSYTNPSELRDGA